MTFTDSQCLKLNQFSFKIALRLLYMKKDLEESTDAVLFYIEVFHTFNSNLTDL